jgi:opacity protein-like surface antigen
MKNAFLVLLMLGALTLAASAQENAGNPLGGRRTGTTALLFSINGFGDFGVAPNLVGQTPLGNSGFDTLMSQLGQMMGQTFARPVYGIAMKFYLSDNIALRAGLGFNMQSENTPVPGDTTGEENTVSRMAFGIAPAVEVHVVQAGPISFYTGGGLSFATASSSTGEGDEERSATQTGIGVNALVGAEFYPWNNISLGAEYQVGAQINSTSSEAGGESNDGPSSTTIGVGGPIRVALGIHF